MKKEILLALAGNANVGKSVIFNQLTGLDQTIGNWPGKTVERAEGTLRHRGRLIRIIDLPGIYSFSTYSQEEIVAQEFIFNERPDVVINVVDASLLERNLFLTLQLLEMEAPVVLALNQVDYARSKGMETDPVRLSLRLGVPVVPTIATRGQGLSELLDAAIEVAEKGLRRQVELTYGSEVERRIAELAALIRQAGLEGSYPARFLAIKLLEGDEGIVQELARQASVFADVRAVSGQASRGIGAFGNQGLEEAVPGKALPESYVLGEAVPASAAQERRTASLAEIEARARELARELEEIHGHTAATILSSERYELAHRITREVQKVFAPRRQLWRERFDQMAMHPVFGFLIMAALLLASFYAIFRFGNWSSEFLGDLLGQAEGWVYALAVPDAIKDILWHGIFEGIIAGITIVLPYILPFYLLLSILENTGYLARIAFLMDAAMHQLGLHGKSLIPLLMGYGCNVPAVLGMRIMENKREMFIAATLATMVPCSARTVVTLGTIGVFLGIPYAIALYLFDLLLIYLTGLITNRYLPGRSPGLIMEIPGYRLPAWGPTLRQTWARIKDFVYVAFPIIIGGSLLLELLRLTHLIEYIGRLFDPLVVGWLGLPSIAGLVLIFGILRKELALIMLAAYSGTTNFAAILNPRQMLVFGLVIMIYTPCVATIAALRRTVGTTRTIIITLAEIGLALLLGGILNWILLFLGW